ncbi:diguanylate cyclase [Pseudonocardia sp. EC080625-04]|uniref:ring-cleaving dioxygenase n=1 Tax=Pseudonocardia sp. EC080625-04 TaxID=1096868 RepID=UPI0006CB39A5|nr:ring-cleaving dioxygenase [Pseudonocardia sp. EC080625-04]ALE76628.1 diguanylate cyclase [Pseudonocardia sp. EC080625-04]
MTTDDIPHGLHHVTAIAGDPQRNADFYTSVLGLRLVKRTVNFDAPQVHHLYYGDGAGRPSTLLTFFPWPGVRPGRQGAGLTTSTAFGIPPESLGWWRTRLAGLGVDADAPVTRDGEESLTLRDPDGLVVELVAAPGDHRSGWDGSGSVPAEHAVRGLHAVTLSEEQAEPTQRMLTELGLSHAGDDGARSRFTAPGPAATTVDVVGGVSGQGLQAGGTVHHIAFRVADRAAQERWRAELVERGLDVTAVLDRQYFTSIYFREPGGVLFEIATDGPGFDVDEPLLELGRTLRLPPWLEPDRATIEVNLPPVTVGG